jgi:ribose/xylose/arabinose/galactoside ABC-type transport system permease subunit
MNYYQIPVVFSIIIGLLIGFVYGLFNGTVIVKFRIPAMIVTLGSMYIGRGIMNVVTLGKPVFPLPDAFNNIGSGTLLAVPYSVWIAAGLAIVASLILKHTVYGRYLYCVGGNEETSRLSGISVDIIKISVYVFSSMFAALSGIIMTSRVTSAQISLGTGWEMTVIAAVIIGGTSMFGGSGTILGTVIGATLMSVISNGIVLMGISAYWQNVVMGALIILAVGIDFYQRRKSGDIS